MFTFRTNARHIYKKQDKQELVENIEIEEVTASTGDRPTDGKDVTSDGRPKSHDVTESQLKFRLKTSGRHAFYYKYGKTSKIDPVHKSIPPLNRSISFMTKTGKTTVQNIL